MATQTTLERIEDAIKWYRSLKADFIDVDLLLRTEREFAALLFDFATETQMLYKQKARCEFQRKAEFSRKRQEGIERQESAAKSEAAAMVEIEQLLKDESESDAEYKAASLLLEVGRDILRVMMQHASHLKNEKRDETNGSGSQAT